MANEITMSATLALKNGNLAYNRQLQNFAINQATARLSSVVQNVTTTAAAALTIGSGVTTLGVGWVRNLDATNYVQIGITVSSTFYPVLRLKPGEGFPLRFEPGATYYAKAAAATCDLEFTVFSD